MPLFGNLAWAEPLALPRRRRAADVRRLYRRQRGVPQPQVAAAQGPAAHAQGGAEEEAEASPVIVPAASLFQADTSMPGRPLRIRVHGLYPPVALDRKRRREVPLAIDLEAIFPSPDPAFPGAAAVLRLEPAAEARLGPQPAGELPVSPRLAGAAAVRAAGSAERMGSTRCCGRSSPSTTSRAARSCGGASTSSGSTPGPGSGRPGSPTSPA